MGEPAPRADGVQPTETLFGWSAQLRRLTPEADGTRPIEVADSWLVEAGRARGLALHAERFVDSCSLFGASERATLEFIKAACEAIPATGRWFPRIEFVRGGGFRLRLRTAPASSSSVILGVCPEGDPRTKPRVKGPDLGALAEVRQRVAEHGAGEALLLAASGAVLEGAFSSVLWWRGDALCLPPPYLPILPSVTRRLLLNIASQRRVEVRFETCPESELQQLEVWVVSALHGIRPVVAWAGRPYLAGPPLNAARWQAELLDQAAPMSATMNAIVSRSLRS